MKKNGDRRVQLIGRERMEIGETAAKQIEEHYAGLGVMARQNIRDAISQWNNGEEPKGMAAAAMFDVFRDIERKMMP